MDAEQLTLHHENGWQAQSRGQDGPRKTMENRFSRLSMALGIATITRAIRSLEKPFSMAARGIRR